MVDDFSALGDHSRLWIFPLPRALSPSEAIQVRDSLREFVAGWKAHGAPVVGAFEVRHSQCVLVAADEQQTGVGGCSIDGLYRTVERMCAGLGVTFLSPAFVQSFQNGTLTVDTREEFQSKVRSGVVGAETIVLDNTITTLGDLRKGGWEKVCRESWHGRAFLESIS